MRIKSALQKSRKQKHSQRRRGEPLDSQDCHIQTERGSGSKGEGGRKGRSERAEFSGALAGRCVQISVCVDAMHYVSAPLPVCPECQCVAFEHMTSICIFGSETFFSMHVIKTMCLYGVAPFRDLIK